MKLSIITIAFNSAETIEATIQSVLAQDYENIEYLIIDGGSTDGTLEIIDKYKAKIDVIISEPDKGLYDAMNKGVLAASGDVVGILNSDDIYAHGQVLTKVMHKFKSESAEAVYADLNYVDRYDTSIVKRKWVSGVYAPGAFRKGWMPPHPTFFTLRLKYTQLGTYNTDLKTSADYELMLRFIHKHKVKLVYLKECIILMRMGGQSNASIKNRVQANKEDRLAWKLNGLKPAAFTFVRKPLGKLKQFIKK